MNAVSGDLKYPLCLCRVTRRRIVVHSHCATGLMHRLVRVRRAYVTLSVMPSWVPWNHGSAFDGCATSSPLARWTICRLPLPFRVSRECLSLVRCLGDDDRGCKMFDEGYLGASETPVGYGWNKPRAGNRRREASFRSPLPSPVPRLSVSRLEPTTSPYNPDPCLHPILLPVSVKTASPRHLFAEPSGGMSAGTGISPWSEPSEPIGRSLRPPPRPSCRAWMLMCDTDGLLDIKRRPDIADRKAHATAYPPLVLPLPSVRA